MRQQRSLFEGIAASDLEEALRGLEVRQFAAGAVIVAEGDYLEEMYVLREGAADVVLVDALGVERELNILGPGEAIGEMSLLTQSPASATVRAREDVELLVLSGADLTELSDALPQVQRNIVATLSARLARLSRIAVDRRLGRVILAERTGGPDVLGIALAASIAWHARSPTLCVLLDTPLPFGVESLETVPSEPPFRRTRRGGADVMVATSTGFFGPERLEGTLEELALVYDHVVLCLPQAADRAPRCDRTVHIDSFDSPGGGFRVTSRSGESGSTIPVPALTDAELAWLREGLLPAEGSAGIGIGAVARDLANLRVGLALGAGSIRGYAHVGAISALRRHGVPVDCIAGTSIGAAVATSYAHFDDPERVADFLDELGSRMFRPRVSRKSFLSTSAMHRYVRNTFGDPQLEELRLPVAVVASDVETQDEVVLRRGDLATAVLASAAVPGVFPAVRIGSRVLVDGGVVNPVPLSVAAALGADVVIGVRLVPPGGSQADEISVAAGGPIPSAVSAIMRSIELLQTRIGTIGPPIPTILITPEFGSVPAGKLRHFRDGRRYIAIGDAAVETAIPRLTSTLPWLRSLSVEEPVTGVR